MKLAVICERKYRDYVTDVFSRHGDSGINIVCFLDTDNTGEYSYQGVPVVKYGRMKERDNEGTLWESILVVAINTGQLSDIMLFLHEIKAENVYVVRWFTINTRKDFLCDTGLNVRSIINLPVGDDAPCLGELQVHVCDHCNLNCKACTHFTPFVREKRCTDIFRYKEDLRELSRLFSNILLFHLMGGEPLLEPELCMEMIMATRKSFPESSINIITNGTLIGNMSADFWKCLRDNSVSVRVSLYPSVINEKDEIRRVLEENRIVYFCEVQNKSRVCQAIIYFL